MRISPSKYQKSRRLTKADNLHDQSHWPYFYERSIGCVGVLKEWLVRATALAMREGSASLQLSHIEKRALSDAKCERMIADVRDGENELRYTEGHRSRLRQLLGMSDGTQQARRTATDMGPSHVRDISTLPPSPPKTASVRVGERAPARDRVGTTDELERRASCSGSGVIDLEVRTLTQSSTSYVECPACGSVRTAQLKGDTVMLRCHYPLVTTTTLDVTRWVKRGTTWTLYKK